MGVGAGANEQQENEKKGLKIEYCGLFVSADRFVSIFFSLALFEYRTLGVSSYHICNLDMWKEGSFTCSVKAT